MKNKPVVYNPFAAERKIKALEEEVSDLERQNHYMRSILHNAVVPYFFIEDSIYKCEDCVSCMEYVPYNSFSKGYKCELIMYPVKPDGCCEFFRKREQNE